MTVGQEGRGQEAAHGSALAATIVLAGMFYMESAMDFASVEQLTITVVFIAAAISSIAGFAFSAIAAPLLLLVISDNVQLVQVMLVSSIALQTYATLSLRRHIRPGALVPCLVGGVMTLPFGLYLLLHMPMQLYVLLLGGFLLIYSTYGLLRRSSFTIAGGMPPWASLIVGALGGLTGPIAAFPGAFITILCSMTKWEKERQRALYQPYILAMQLMTLVALGASRPSEVAPIVLLQYAVPAMIGAYLGLRVFNSLTAKQFQRVVNIFLLFAGAGLTLKAL